MDRGAWPEGVEYWNNQRVTVTGRRGVLGPARRMVSEKRSLKRSLHFVGARPNLMRIAPIMREMAQCPAEFEQIASTPASTTTPICRRCSSMSWNCPGQTYTWRSAPARTRRR